MCRFHVSAPNRRGVHVDVRTQKERRPNDAQNPFEFYTWRRHVIDVCSSSSLVQLATWIYACEGCEGGWETPFLQVHQGLLPLSCIKRPTASENSSSSSNTWKKSNERDRSSWPPRSPFGSYFPRSSSVVPCAIVCSYVPRFHHMDMIWLPHNWTSSTYSSSISNSDRSPIKEHRHRHHQCLISMWWHDRTRCSSL